MIELVAFVGLGGVNNVFSHVFLILVATSSIFAKSLLTNFLALVQRTCAPMFLEQNMERMGFLKQDARGNLVVASLPLNFPFSGFLLKVSAVNVHWTEQDSYLSSSLSLNWHFLALAKLRSTARVWNHQRISKLVNKVDCRLSSDSFLTLHSKVIVRAFLATNASQQDLQRTHAMYGICHLSDDSFLALCSSNSAGLPCYESFAEGFLLCVK
jgi:hypothetical protein